MTIFAIFAMLFALVVIFMARGQIRAASRRPANGELKTLERVCRQTEQTRTLVEAIIPGFRVPRHWP